MKRISRLKTLFGVAVAMSLAFAPLLAASPDYDAVAANLVNEAAAVQPGEIVVIGGNPDQIDLMAAVQVAVAKAGGQSILTINIPAAGKRVVLETPMEYLSQLPTAGLLLGRIADVFINVASVQQPGLFADVPEERLAAVRQAASPLTSALSAASVRNVTLGQTGGIPTPAYADNVGADHESLVAMFWEASAVSSSELAARGKRVAGKLGPGKAVRMSSKEGTDLSFTVGPQPARINAGRTADVVTGSGAASVWLPAGEAYATVASGSAAGTLVVPSMNFRGQLLEDLRMTFDGGRLVDLAVGEGNPKLLQEFLAASSDQAKTLSVVDIGLNTKSRPAAGSRHLSWEMGGLVTLGLGNNAWAGGTNAAEGAITFHVPEATLEVAGAPLVTGGRLAD